MPYLSLALALSLIAGLAGGVLVDRPIALAGSLTLSAAWAAMVLSYARGFPRLLLTAISILLIGAGWILGAHAVDRAHHPPLRMMLEQRLGGVAIDAVREELSNEPIVIEGRLQADATPTASGATLRIDVTRLWLGSTPEETAGGVSVGVGGALHAAHLSQWTAGRVIRAPALLRRPARYLNEGLPDQERALARRGITLVGTIKSATLVEVVEKGAWWAEGAARIRARTRLALERHVKPLGTQSAAIATAILIGDRAGLDVEVERRLQEAGTYHVIAISGGNIAILAGVALATFAWMGLGGRVAPIATIAMLAAYAVVAGGGPSVERATLMAVVYLAVRLIDQRTASANAIGLAAAVLLLADPLAIVDVGFWLTFGATAAIAVGVASTPMRWAGWLSVVLGVLVATCFAELALAPVSAIVFQRVTLAGLLVNFAALPAMTVVQLGAMAVVSFDLVGLVGLARFAGQFVHVGSVVLTDSARFVNYAPWLTWRVPSPHVLIVVSYYAALTLSLVVRMRSPRWTRGATGASLATAGLFIWIIATPAARVAARGDGRLHLTLFDVGQGDAMLVTFPNGRRLLVDTGGVSTTGGFDIGDRVIGPALRARQLLSLDYLAITHGDPDHIGGAHALVRDFAPREIWWGVPVANHAPTMALQAEAIGARAAWRTLNRGDRVELGGVEIRVHHPPPADWERQKVRNDDSLVMELRYGQVSMLLTGDIGREVEHEMGATLDLLPSVVLKVAHHGSATSSTAAFVARIRPAIAMIGVGRGNSYGHPVPHVLERLRSTKTEIFRTDLDGQITVSTDGRVLRATSYTGRLLDIGPAIQDESIGKD